MEGTCVNGGSRIFHRATSVSTCVLDRACPFSRGAAGTSQTVNHSLRAGTTPVIVGLSKDPPKRPLLLPLQIFQLIKFPRTDEHGDVISRLP